MYGHFMLQTVRHAQSVASREQRPVQARDKAMQG